MKIFNKSSIERINNIHSITKLNVVITKPNEYNNMFLSVHDLYNTPPDCLYMDLDMFKSKSFKEIEQLAIEYYTLNHVQD